MYAKQSARCQRLARYIVDTKSTVRSTAKLAILNTGADIVTYGAPVLPGAMFLVSYLDGVPVCGLPGCVMYAKRTIFDLLLPRLLADDAITAEDIARLGEGGLCLGCAQCHWPNCGFGHC